MKYFTMLFTSFDGSLNTFNSSLKKQIFRLYIYKYASNQMKLFWNTIKNKNKFIVVMQ